MDALPSAETLATINAACRSLDSAGATALAYVQRIEQRYDAIAAQLATIDQAAALLGIDLAAESLSALDLTLILAYLRSDCRDQARRRDRVLSLAGAIRQSNID